MPPKVCRWLMAAGKRPVPFRTRKLSPPAPMVLPPGGSGRVGYRRPNNFTQAPATQHHRCAAGAFHMRGPNPPGWTPHCGQQQERQLWVLTHKTRGVTTQQGAYCGKVEYRTSSTPTYTDGLDLHYSTNNAPTTTQGWSTIRIADNRPTTHHWRTPMNTPGRNHPAGRDLPTRGHIGRGASARSHDDAYCGAKVEYRTSSTPAYTDGLDLHHSTNNTPTTTRGRPRLRIADNKSQPHDGCPPTNYLAGLS